MPRNPAEVLPSYLCTGCGCWPYPNHPSHALLSNLVFQGTTLGWGCWQEVKDKRKGAAPSYFFSVQSCRCLSHVAPPTRWWGFPKRHRYFLQHLHNQFSALETLSSKHTGASWLPRFYLICELRHTFLPGPADLNLPGTPGANTCTPVPPAGPIPLPT